MKLAKRTNAFDSSLKIDESSIDVKIASLKAKLARRNNSMKSHSQLEPAASPMAHAGAIVAFSGTNQKKTGKREGLLRMVNAIGENEAERLEAEERKLQVLNRNLLGEYSRTGNFSALVRKEDSVNSRSSLDSPEKDLTAVSSKMLVPTSNIISIRDFPATSRYLLKNIFGATHSPREGMKDVISGLRTMFYTKMSIDAKQEETVKLNEYIMMEQEKIIEARIKFDEDCDRFTKYVKDVDH